MVRPPGAAGSRVGGGVREFPPPANRMVPHHVSGLRAARPMALVLRQQTIIIIISRNRLRWLGHLFRLPDDRLAKQVLFGTLADSNGRGKGAPRLSWIDCIYKDMEAAGISLGTQFRKKVL